MNRKHELVLLNLCERNFQLVHVKCELEQH